MWTESEINWLIKNYPLLGKKQSSIYLGKSESSIRMKTFRLGLKQDRNSDFFSDWQSRAATSKIGKKRPAQANVLLELHRQGKLKMTDDGKLKTSIRTKKMIAEHGHPKGMLGKKHSLESLRAMSESAIKMWENPDSIVNSDLHRQKLSDRALMRQRNGSLNKGGYSRGKQGKRADLNNIFFRSSWEANYARYLNFLILKNIIHHWEFESDTFWFDEIKRGTRSYLPDFKIWDTIDSIPYYVEVKGWMDDKSKTKLKRMKKYFPEIRVDIFGQKEYKELNKKFAGLIKNWES